MRKLVWLILIAIVVSLSACSASNTKLNDDLVFVEGEPSRVVSRVRLIKMKRWIPSILANTK